MARGKKAEAPTGSGDIHSQIMGMMNRAFPNTKIFVSIDENAVKVSRPHLPTGSIIVDYLIGGKPNSLGVRPCPGFPRGCIVNLYGQESSGKTTLGLTVAAKTIQNGGKVGYIDWENAIDVAYAGALGVPLDDPAHFMLAQPESLEQGISLLWIMAKGGYDLIVIDSVGAGTPQAILDQSLPEKGEMGRIGLNAAKWSKVLPELKLIISRSGTCVLGVSQLRKNIGKQGYGPDTLAQGGEAWKFYSEVRLSLQKISQEKGREYNALTHTVEETTVGQTVRCRIDKCKVSASQGKSASFHIQFGEGIDDLRSAIEIVLAHGGIKGKYNFTRANGEIVKGQGMAAFRNALQETPGAVEEIYTAAYAAFASDKGMIAEKTEEQEEEEDISEVVNLMADKKPEEFEDETVG